MADQIEAAFSFFPGTPEWRHKMVSEEIAKAILRAAISNGSLPIWVRTSATEESVVDHYALRDIDHQTLKSGTYISHNHPRPFLDGRPLWVKDADWLLFLSNVMADRYGQATSQSRAPTYKTSRPPDKAAILAKADEMRKRDGLKTYEIASRMRHEVGFENVATRDVREYLKGRYKREGRAGITKE